MVVIEVGLRLGRLATGELRDRRWGGSDVDTEVDEFAAQAQVIEDDAGEAPVRLLRRTRAASSLVA